MARAAVLAAGGIVLRPEETPLVAVVRLRKRNEWVLPKGKLDDGETPREAAEREVLEETCHDVSVHDFLGTLVYKSGGRCKVVHYWRMEVSATPSRALMNDVRAVDWLPLEDAVERLSRNYERAFLENVGPLALEAAVARRPTARKQAVLEKRRRQPVPVRQRPPTIPAPVVPLDEPAFVLDAMATSAAEEPSVTIGVAPSSGHRAPVEVYIGRRINLLQKVRNWFATRGLGVNPEFRAVGGRPLWRAFRTQVGRYGTSEKCQ